jgi:AraC-like DNA-binding protein
MPIRRTDDHGLQVFRHRPLSGAGPHVHEQIEVLVVEQGSLTHHQAGQALVLGPGDLLAFWAAFPHWTVQASPDLQVLFAYLPLEWFLGVPAWSAGVSFWLSRGVVRGRGHEHLTWLQAVYAMSTASDPVALHRIRLASELHLLDVVMADRSAAATSEGLQRHVAAMISLVLSRYAEPLTADDVARAAGLHPNYAMAVFRRATGLRLWDFVQQVRVAQAQRLLLEPGRSVLGVGLAAGFGSEARFHAVFRKLVGTSPDRYRKRSGDPAQMLRPGAD